MPPLGGLGPQSDHAVLERRIDAVTQIGPIVCHDAFGGLAYLSARNTVEVKCVFRDCLLPIDEREYLTISAEYGRRVGMHRTRGGAKADWMVERRPRPNSRTTRIAISSGRLTRDQGIGFNRLRSIESAIALCPVSCG